MEQNRQDIDFHLQVCTEVRMHSAHLFEVKCALGKPALLTSSNHPPPSTTHLPSPSPPLHPHVPKRKPGTGWIWSISIGQKRKNPVNVGTEQKIGIFENSIMRNISLCLSLVLANREFLRYFQPLSTLHKSEMTWQMTGQQLPLLPGGKS